MSSSRDLLSKMSRREAHEIFKEQIDCLHLSILEKTRYRLDPVSERQIHECLHKLRFIAANSRLIDRNEPSTESSDEGNVLYLVKRAGKAAA